MVKDFRPISLIHSFAKLVTKILANRLTLLLAGLVSNNQSAFVRGRNIHDNFLLVQQLARTLHKSKEPHIFLRLDISKVFYTVSWSFLIEVLQHLGFGRRWCDLIWLLLLSWMTQRRPKGRRKETCSLPCSLSWSWMFSILNTESFYGKPATPYCWMSKLATDSILWPSSGDLQVVRDLLHSFGHVTGLKTNILKSSVIPINCSEEDITHTSDTLSCVVSSFPYTYLRIPLTIHKPSRADLMLLIDKVADKLPGWKPPLLNKADCLVLVKSVLTTTPIHLDSLGSAEQLIRGVGSFGKDKNKPMVVIVLCHGNEFNGLSSMGGLALCIHWLWFLKRDSLKPWSGLPFQVPRKAQALFDMAVYTQIGNGDQQYFGCVADIAPNLFKLIPNRLVKRRTVSQAHQNRCWVGDIKGALTVTVLVEYLTIWDLVDGIVLQPDTLDQYKWKLSSTGVYNSKSAYNAMFVGTIKFSPWKRIWKTWAPPKCRIEVWTWVLRRSNLPDIMPPGPDNRFNSWWSSASRSKPKELRKGFNALVILIHRNACVFEGISPEVQFVLLSVASEGHLWCQAGAPALQELFLRIP
ncbi:hypothetical protein U9M48_036389 [Paspalum notatum var. saurae]|uniref:Reverse transcriptase domain-containing protein n=1 Tax=Paspalum notatum var. saurae TaxID=547442 RepID=A0AAQ3XA08_PASNO